LRPTWEIPPKGEELPPPKEEPHLKTVEEKPELKEALPKAKKSGMGLRFKIFILFFLLPILLFVGAAYLYLWQLGNLSALITQESSKAVTQLGEQIIAEKARSVASQVRLYLLSHPDLKKEAFDADPEFKKLAVQKWGSQDIPPCTESRTVRASGVTGLTPIPKCGSGYEHAERTLWPQLCRILEGVQQWKRREGVQWVLPVAGT